jgi:hypothetical protein
LTDKDVLERLCILPILRSYLHDHVILVSRIVNRRYLALAEGVIERVVDQGDRNAEPRRRIAVDDDIRFQPIVLLVAIYLRHLRNLLQLSEDLRRPCKQLVRTVGLECVLILRVGGATADADVLHRLQKQRCPWNLRQLAAQPADHLIRRYLALAERLERNEDEAAIGLSAAGEADHDINRRILLDDRNELLQLLPHQLERYALVGLDAAVDPTRILLREKALGNDHVEIEVEAERDGHDQDNEQGVVERPREATIINPQREGEELLARAMETSVMLTLRPPERQRAHHRRGGE